MMTGSSFNCAYHGPELPPEQVIEWLRSRPGMQWSRKRHPRNSNMTWWFQLKRDQEYRDSQDDPCPLDDEGDLVAVDLGWFNLDCDYRRGPRDEYVPYGKPVE